MAWGDTLPARPAVIVVHDLLGREVMRQGVGERQRDALLSCDDLMAGGYLLSLHRHDGVLLSTVMFVKR